MIAVLFCATIFVGAALGNVGIPTNARQGNLNKYFLYTREYDNARTSITMPTIEEIKAEDSSDSDTSTTSSTTSTTSVDDNEENILIPELNADLDTIVIVHGHGGDKDTTLNPLIKNSFFDESARADVDVNVIVVDWSSYTKQSYSLASSAVASVGKNLGEYLKALIDTDRIKLEQLHLIGFNLGAHVVGFAGRELGGQAARITGLDPSGSGWGSSSPRLSKSDARYVEVIHTDGDCLLCNGLGVAIGHVDFFVNGGKSQPGCITHSCCHNRAYELFAATLVRSEKLYGHLCNSNLQLTLNMCRGSPTIHVGGDELFKRHDSNNVYRVNTGRTFPY